MLSGEATNTNFIVFDLTRTHDLVHSRGGSKVSSHLHDKMKNKKYNAVRIVPKSNRKIVERIIDIPNTQIHDHSHSWLGTGTSLKSVIVKLPVLRIPKPPF